MPASYEVNLSKYSARNIQETTIPGVGERCTKGTVIRGTSLPGRGGLIPTAPYNYKEAGMVKLIQNKTDFKTRSITK